MATEVDAADMGRTTISVSDELADELYERKKRGESYEDVLWRLLDDTEGSSSTTPRVSEEPPARDDEPIPAPTEPAERSIEDVVDEVGRDVLPGSGEKLEERIGALQAVVAYLREHGTATPAEFKAEVYPEHTGRYTQGENPERSWWKNCIYKGLSEVAARVDEIETADTTGEWSYIESE